MGVAVSHWPLARAVAVAGQLGVVSGTGIDTVFVRRIQDHGVDDQLRSILARFPCQAVVERVLARFGSSRRGAHGQYRGVPMPTHRSLPSAQDLYVLSAYAEVAQAKAGHDGFVGINLLTKIQIPTVPTLFGAMLAGVDYVLMGAGIPAEIPGILDRLAAGHPVETQLLVTGSVTGRPLPVLRFEPQRLSGPDTVARPRFVAIVSSHVLAKTLARNSTGRVDGFVVERHIAGGHNAPPRGPLRLDDAGEPIYGERDRADFAAIGDLGVPFWIAGGITSAEAVRDAFELGASGVQVGTLFECCRESGLDPTLKARLIAAARTGSVRVMTSVRASSTGYPFKVARVEGTLSDEDVYARRPRVCDLGYLREAYLKPDGTVGHRCAGEPIESYVAKGGLEEDTVDRACLCNSLVSAAGFGQIRRRTYREPAIVTSGDAINDIARMVADRDGYSAADVIDYLRPGRPQRGPAGV
jgi:NAD(P)H-dependent flavin oxidoreductase YrpB (nitropropane dioxygenase family)